MGVRLEPRGAIVPVHILWSARVLLGAFAVGCAALAQHQAPRDEAPVWVLCATLLAIVAAAIAFRSPIEAAPRLSDECRLPARQAWLAAVPLVMAAVPAAILWDRQPFRATHTFATVGSSWAALLWLGGMLAALLVAWRNGRGARAGSAPTRRHIGPSGYREAALLTAILALALALRTWHLDSLPFGVVFDEVDSEANARALLHLPLQAYAPGNYGHNPSLYFYLLAALIHAGGGGIGTIRLASVLFGLLGVLAAYLIGRRGGGPALALPAAALIAVATWSIIFSRVALPDIAVPAMVGLGICALCYALYRPSSFSFLLSGLVLGLSLLTYQGAFLPALAALILTAGRLRLDGSFRQRALASVAFLPLGMLIGALPLLVASHLDPAYATARISSVSITHEYADWTHLLPAILRNVERHALMFTVSGDLNGRHNLPGAPMLDPLTGSLFLLGLGICLRHIWHWFYALLLLWLGASLLGGILSMAGDAPQGARSIGALIPVALIAALPLAAIRLATARPVLGSAKSHSPLAPPGPVASPSDRVALHHAPLDVSADHRERSVRFRGRLAAPRGDIGTLAVAALLIALIGLNVERYFGRQATNLQSWTAMDGRVALVGQAAVASIRAGYTVQVDPLLGADRVLQYPVLRFDARADLTILDPAHPVPRPLPPGGVALIISAGDPALYQRLRKAYPAASVRALTPAFDHGAVQAWVLLLR